MPLGVFLEPGRSWSSCLEALLGGVQGAWNSWHGPCRGEQWGKDILNMLKFASESIACGFAASQEHWNAPSQVDTIASCGWALYTCTPSRLLPVGQLNYMKLLFVGVNVATLYRFPWLRI